MLKKYLLALSVLVISGCQTIQTTTANLKSDPAVSVYYNYQVPSPEESHFVHPHSYLKYLKANKVQFKTFDAQPSDIRELSELTKVTHKPTVYQSVSPLQKQVNGMVLAVYESTMPSSPERMTQGLAWFKDLLIAWSNREPISAVYGVDIPIYLATIGTVTELYAVFRDDLGLTYQERLKIDQFLGKQWRAEELNISGACRYPSAPDIGGQCHNVTLMHAKWLAVAGKTLGDKELLDQALSLTIMTLKYSRPDGSNIHDSQRGGMAKLYTLDGAKFMLQIGRIFESMGVDFWDIQPSPNHPSTKDVVNFAINVIHDDRLVKQYAKAMGPGSKGKDWQTQYLGGATVGQFVFEAQHSFLKRFRPDAVDLIRKPLLVAPVDPYGAIHAGAIEATIFK